MATYRVGFDWAQDTGGRWLREGRESVDIIAPDETAARLAGEAAIARQKMGRLHIHYARRWWALLVCDTCQSTQRDCSCQAG